MTCHDCNKKIDLYEEPVVCYSIDRHKFVRWFLLVIKKQTPPKMEFTCVECSRSRSDGSVRRDEK